MKPYLLKNRRVMLWFATIGSFALVLLVAPWALAGDQAGTTGEAADETKSGPEKKLEEEKGSSEKAMQIFYLEIVTKEVDAVCATYAAANGVQFGKPDAGLGNARTAKMPGGGMVGVRVPMRDSEEPVVRPYWLVDDINTAVAAAVKAGGELAHPPMEIPGHGTFAIYLQGGIDHGLWQR